METILGFQKENSGVVGKAIGEGKQEGGEEIDEPCKETFGINEAIRTEIKGDRRKTWRDCDTESDSRRTSRWK